MLADSCLRQLFYNFIDNTRKYGKKTTTIKLHYEKTDQDNLKLIYEDDGVGVPLENKTHLFKEGFSTGNSTGYGLFFTKKMMDVYGWKIEENGEPGTGAKFTITIPKINPNGKENFKLPKNVGYEAGKFESSSWRTLSLKKMYQHHNLEPKLALKETDNSAVIYRPRML